MANFRNSEVIDYPASAVFELITSMAKRDFPNYDENKPIGSSVEKEVGKHLVKPAKMKVEITDFNKDKLYEVTSTQVLPREVKIFKSRYILNPVGKNSTEVILEESENANGFISGMNSLIVGIAYKRRVKTRF
ncbi:MAG: DUF3284 domain-containing protein, partial [Clostridium sp.]